ncbi:protein serine/threonine phosphatase 2C [Saitoella complicata NRRL Y-17804]|uniref:protein serine/threonine phosphatase 2C n=1 Tax=Saitoella complicata (strain BCRC 22490 / CBS 7301 / JCM 7358 / NBRC 10748 / NRRL Y-17804) TaxID=698492 RepID=UPI000868208A|nr:protein serine/threonine phosphatase 2C [Saitoella complicata NRRL Y-17804]ODQ55328.1 protein serine/threonine phosphatase 2C [Saitoella complicata NRRL Y-17804]
MSNRLKPPWNTQRQRRYLRDYFHPPGSNVRIPILTAKTHLGVATSRGNRLENEDRSQVGILEMPRGRRRGAWLGDIFYFSVVDGHGGHGCADFIRNTLHSYIERADPSQISDLLQNYRDRGGYFRRFEPKSLVDLQRRLDAANKQSYVELSLQRMLARFGRGNGGVQMSMEERLELAFLKADQVFMNGATLQNAERKRDLSGAVASCALVTSSDPDQPFWTANHAELHIAHVGDTRVLLCHANSGKARAVTVNHHPDNPLESARLRKFASGFVTDSFGEERFGAVANTRAFGDVRWKRMGVSAEPFLQKLDLYAPSPKDSDVEHGPNEDSVYAYMVLVSDGVTSVASDQEIIDIVKHHTTPSKAAEAIVKFAEQLGTDDNSTCMVVRLQGWPEGVGKLVDAGVEDFTGELRGWRVEGREVGGRRRQ